MILSISGLPGSGKSTVAKILVERLSLDRFYMGQILRDKAKDMGITLEELLILAKNDGGKIDNELDEIVKSYGLKNDNFIIESRTAWHFIPNSKKIFIDVDIDESAKRIYKDRISNSDRNEEPANSVEEVKQQIIERIENEKNRYMKYYGINPYDTSNFDIVIDSTNLSPDEVAQEIMKQI